MQTYHTKVTSFFLDIAYVIAPILFYVLHCDI